MPDFLILVACALVLVVCFLILRRAGLQRICVEFPDGSKVEFYGYMTTYEPEGFKIVDNEVTFEIYGIQPIE